MHQKKDSIQCSKKDITNCITKGTTKDITTKLTNVFIALILLLGLCLMSYPFISNWYMQTIQDSLIQEYDRDVSAITSKQKQEELAKCRQYNHDLLGTVELSDPFDPTSNSFATKQYESLLSTNNSKIMGYVDIPKINVHLPIYHGTSSEVLDKGVGHLANTSLPIGGQATHSVLSAHTAYAKATMFNDLTQLEKGDEFCLSVLGDTLVYKIDQIKVVEPHTTSDLLIDRNEDFVTLVTCTPYGINSHRLLVRGVKMPYEKALNTDVVQETPSASCLGGIAVIATVLVVMVLLIRKRHKRKSSF